MSQLANDPVFQSYVASVVLLSLNLLGLGSATAVSRSQATEVVNPEDKRLNPKASVVFDEGNDRTQRYRRAHRNALENTPMFMITGLLMAMLGPSLALAATLYGTYAFARILHSVCYVKGIQPFRTMFFAIGVTAQLTVLGYIVYAVFIAS